MHISHDPIKSFYATRLTDGEIPMVFMYNQLDNGQATIGPLWLRYKTS